MRKAFLTGLIYCLVALSLEQAVLPFFGLDWEHVHLAEMRLVAAGLIVGGFLRRDWEAAIFAFLIAIPCGAALGPGFVGCTLVSYTAVAWIASISVKWFYVEQFTIRFAVLFGLIIAESWAWSATRRWFWPETPLELQWPTHLVAAFILAILYIPAARMIRYRAGETLPIGRRRST